MAYGSCFHKSLQVVSMEVFGGSSKRMQHKHQCVHEEGFRFPPNRLRVSEFQSAAHSVARSHLFVTPSEDSSPEDSTPSTTSADQTTTTKKTKIPQVVAEQTKSPTTWFKGLN